MKKVVSLILALLMCLSLCACGGQKYVGTYVNEKSELQDSRDVLMVYYGTRTLVLNKDGTGKIEFVAKKGGTAPWAAKELEPPKKAYDFPITWEVVDGYLYMEGKGTNEIDGSSEALNGSNRYRLEGKTLQRFSAGEWYDAFTKTQ